MKQKLLLLLSLAGLFSPLARSQYLNDYYKLTSVIFKNNQSGQYMEADPAANGGQPVLYQWPGNINGGYFNQNFKIEAGVTANYYRIRHLATAKYVTVISSPGDAQLRNLGDCPNTDYQEFRFIQQATAYLYKIHAHFSHGGIDEVLCINNGTGNGAGLKLQTNQTTGNSNHQQWYLTNITPPANPGDALPSLEDTYEGKTVGLEEQQHFFDLRGTPAGNTALEIYANTNYNGFETQFKIEYTADAGWYAIKHKPSGKYLTIKNAYDGGAIELQPYGQTDRQKFKFIFKSAGKYEIHSKYKQGPEPGNNAALLLQMHPANADVRMYLGIDNTSGASSDGWQQFKLTKYVNPAVAAAFDGGASIDALGTLVGKQYYISSRETGAMFEPYIVGTDTFVRVQQNPVYTDRAEWTIDAGERKDIVIADYQKSVRIRYGKTNQYLFLPASSPTASVSGGLRLRLTRDTGFSQDKRYQFTFQTLANPNNWSKMGCFAGGGDGVYFSTDDDGFLQAATASPNAGIDVYHLDEHFAVNLALPPNNNAFANRVYSISGKTNGRLVSDSGNTGTSEDLVHVKYADQSCVYSFIGLDNNNFYIKNQLTGGFITMMDNKDVKSTALPDNGPGIGSSQWRIERDNNYYHIREAGTGLYLRITNGAVNNYVVVNDATFSGRDLVVSRADLVTTPDLLVTGNYDDVLQNYVVLPINAFNDNAYRDKLIRNIGLPFEPSLRNTLSPGTASQELQDEGFSTSNPPVFYPVVRAALKYRYRYSDAQLDAAFKNYKLDNPGHRVQLSHAVKNYLLDSLAQKPRSAWNYNEQEMVAWFERKIKGFKEDYANRLAKSWEDFKIAEVLNADDPLQFSALLDDAIPAYENYSRPEYIIPLYSETESLAEYLSVCKIKNYFNPGKLGVSLLPGLLTPGFSIALSGYLSKVALPGVKALILASIASEEIAIFGEEIASSAVSGVSGATSKVTTETLTKISRFLKSITGAGASTFIAEVAIMAIQLIVMEALDVKEYNKFFREIDEKVFSLQNTPININSTMQGKNILRQAELSQDFDYILGAGQRYDDYASNIYVFTGNGNWNLATNWSNSMMPPSTLPDNAVVYINPSGQCNLNVPVTVPVSARIVVKPGKLLRVQSTLTIPNLSIIK